MSATVYAGGFADAPVEAAHAFRAVMTAMARPGEVRTVAGGQGPAPLSVAASVAVLTLCDADTKVHLAGGYDTQDVRAWITFHTGAPFVPAAEAGFVLGDWAGVLPLSHYRIGTPEYPDRSATLIVELDALQAQGATLSGPGIKDTAQFSLPDVAPLQDNAALYPLGVDFIWTCGAQLAALPRSTQIRGLGHVCSSKRRRARH